MHVIVSKALSTREHYNGKDETLDDAIAFLKLLSEVPPEYREGKKRILLLRAIFENCHNIISVKNALGIKYGMATLKSGAHQVAVKKEFSYDAFIKDFRPLALLKNKFPGVNNILQKVAGLPELREPLVLEENTEGESESTDLIEQLISNNKTFYAGSLVKRIWSGLNIPVHSALPSEQPLGGVSDLTNKGDFDKLLISEFANEDIVFLSRLANNEALYIHREIPPASNNMQRIILIDISLKNWGTPKTIAYATMLAIAKHPKTTIGCKAFAVGNHFYPVSIESIGSIIDALQLLDGTLHCGNGLDAFFKEHPKDKNNEIFLVTEPSTLKQAGMLKAVNEYQPSINYLVHTDAEGNIDVYKKQQNTKKHIQHILLPLKELWKNPPANKKRELSPKRRHNDTENIPMLFRHTNSMKTLLCTADGEAYMITKEKQLFRFYDKFAKPYERGWELVYDKLPFSAGEFEIGILGNGERMLFMFNPQTKEVTLLNIETGDVTQLVFPQWSKSPGFVFYNDKFYHPYNSGFFSIAADGTKKGNESLPGNVIADRQKQLQQVRSAHPYAHNVFRNISKVFINEKGKLMFNIHQLEARGHGMYLTIARETGRKASTVRETDTRYVFDDGSSISIDPAGVFILKSSDPAIPVIYITSEIDSPLGAATDLHFAGNEYFYKEPQHRVRLIDAGQQVLSVIKAIKEITETGLQEAKGLVDIAPFTILDYASSKKTEELRQAMQKAGATIGIIPLKKPGAAEQKKIALADFYTLYIEKFINTILAHGIKN